MGLFPRHAREGLHEVSHLLTIPPVTMRLSCIHQYNCYRVIWVVFVSQHTKSGKLTAARARYLAKHLLLEIHHS